MSRTNPWLQDADVGATGETYEIRAVADFLKVPESRRYVCLREFHAWLTILEGTRDLLVTCGVPADAIHPHTDVFRWSDDGKATVSVRMQPLGRPGAGDEG
jgi:hypothetical protein